MTHRRTTAVPSVLHVLAPPRYGGLGQVVSALTRGLAARGRPVHVLAILDTGDGDHPLVQELGAGGVPVTSIEVAARAYGAERAHVRRVAEGVHARIVHTHGTRVDVVDAPAAQRAGLATVSTLHGFTGGGAKNRLYEWLQVRAARRRDAVVAVSRPIAARVGAAGVPSDRLWTVPNAWSPICPPLERSVARARLGLPDHGFRVGWVGRLTSEKGADLLIEALSIASDLPVLVSIIGSGPERPRLEALAERLGVTSRVTWHGAVPEAGRLMTAFDAFVLSSRTEGTPIALFEAMAARVPVVATAVGGVPDVVSDREAVLASPDDPAALAASLSKLYRNPREAIARARAAEDRLARHFALDPWLDAYEEVYLAAARRSSAAERSA